MQLRPLVLALALALPVSSAFAQQQVKFGIVDIQAVLVKANDLAAARQKLQQSSRQKTEQLAKEEQSLMQEIQIFQVQAQSLPQADQQKRANELKNKREALMTKAQKVQQELAESTQRELRRVQDKLQPIVAKIAEREGFAMVLTTDAVMWNSPGASKDITNEVISTYNATKAKTADAPVKSDAPVKK